VMSISSNAFYYCYGMKSLIMLPTSPPTLGSSNALSNNASDRKILVPNGSLSAYQSASNWSTYASQMEEMP